MTQHEGKMTDKPVSQLSIYGEREYAEFKLRCDVVGNDDDYGEEVPATVWYRLNGVTVPREHVSTMIEVMRAGGTFVVNPSPSEEKYARTCHIDEFGNVACTRTVYREGLCALHGAMMEDIRESEESVVGGVILHGKIGERFVDAIPTMFESPKLQVIWESILAIAARNAVIDVCSLEVEIEKRGQLEAAGGLSYLGEIALASQSP